MFATTEASPFDVAVLELQDSVPSFQPPDLATTFQPGECQLQVGGVQGTVGCHGGMGLGQWHPMGTVGSCVGVPLEV